MRLTSPRWASRFSEAIGNGHRPALINQLQSLPDHDKRRRDVINPDLCNEAIDVLRSSLPQPATCDVIDVSPGAGVWSQCLHEALKPRRHVFVETEYESYKQQLSPLLEKSSSTYCLAPTINDALDENSDFLSSTLRNSLAPWDRQDNRVHNDHQSTKPQLIITANLAQKAVKSNGFQGEMSKLFFEHFYRSTAMGTGAFPWHKYGLVKLLAWIPEADKNSFNPRCTSFRYRASKQLEASCMVREIVSSFPNDGRRSQHMPWHGAALQSMDEVAAIQARDNTHFPPYRQQPAPEPPSIFIPPIEANIPLLKSLKDKPRLVDEYIAAYRALKSSNPKWLENYMEDPNYLRHNLDPTVDAADPRRVFGALSGRMRTTHNRYAKVDDVARTQVELERQLIACRQSYPNQPDRYLKLLKKLQPEFDALQQTQDRFFKDNKHAARKAIDDYRALNYDPHLLNWNNRTFEPLLCHPKIDFYPHQPMSLLEVTPRPEFVETINTADRQIIFDYVSHLLNFERQRSVKEVLERLVGSGEGYEKFVGEFGAADGIPSLTDPLHGGHHDLEDLRARSLGSKQMIDIVLKYEKWPWRMGLNEMIETVSRFRSGKQVF